MGRKKKETKEKPLEKLTAKELREIALQVPDITGVHGLNKDELVSIIETVAASRKRPGNQDNTVREIKAKMRGITKLSAGSFSGRKR